MQIAPPFGYKQVIPFQKTHKVRLLAPGEAPEFVRDGAAIPISHSEFVPAGRHYPIVFIGDGKTYNAGRARPTCPPMHAVTRSAWRR
jgi:hypothetical protein